MRNEKKLACCINIGETFLPYGQVWLIRKCPREEYDEIFYIFEACAWIVLVIDLAWIPQSIKEHCFPDYLLIRKVTKISDYLIRWLIQLLSFGITNDDQRRPTPLMTYIELFTYAGECWGLLFSRVYDAWCEKNVLIVDAEYFASSSSLGTAPKILRTETSFAGTSSAGPMNQIERVQYQKRIFWSCWIRKYNM